MRQQLRSFRAIIIGPPGCGKGFVANKIKELFGTGVIATGDILREHIKNGTDIGKQALDYIRRGELVPDHLLRQLVLNKIRLYPENFLLDGYPRNIMQACDLDTQTKLDLVINVNIPPAAILKRVMSRIIHPASGRVYSTYGSNKPRIAGVDDITGEPLVRRIDDDPKIWSHRLAIFEETMNPVIEYYDEKCLTANFHVNKHEDLWPEIERYLNSKVNIES